MATRAEMEAELEVLRAKMAEVDAAATEAEATETTEVTGAGAPEVEAPEADATTADATTAEATTATEGPDEMASSEEGRAGRRQPPRPPAFDEAKTEIERVLASHGVSVDEIEALAGQLWEELDTLPQNKPLITAIGAFALGFLLGRMTK